MDIGQLRTSETADCEIRDAKGELSGAVITLHGMNSNVYRNVMLRAARRRMSAADGGKLDNAKIEDEAQDLADMTVGWSGFEDGGKEFPFTRENAVKLYTMSLDVRSQLNNFQHKPSNFLPKA